MQQKLCRQDFRDDLKHVVCDKSDAIEGGVQDGRGRRKGRLYEGAGTGKGKMKNRAGWKVEENGVPPYPDSTTVISTSASKENIWQLYNTSVNRTAYIRNVCKLQLHAFFSVGGQPLQHRNTVVVCTGSVKNTAQTSPGVELSLSLLFGLDVAYALRRRSGTRMECRENRRRI